MNICVKCTHERDERCLNPKFKNAREAVSEPNMVTGFQMHQFVPMTQRQRGIRNSTSGVVCSASDRFYPMSISLGLMNRLAHPSCLEARYDQELCGQEGREYKVPWYGILRANFGVQSK